MENHWIVAEAIVISGENRFHHPNILILRYLMFRVIMVLK